MFSVYNITEQTVRPGEALILDGINFLPNCAIKTVNRTVRAGIQRISASINSTPTVAGQIVWDVEAGNTPIPGATIQTPGTTPGTYENGSTEVIIPTVYNTSIQLVNNSENPVTVPARGASLVVKREG
ncbi:MAG: hypothetical protein IJ568_06400 [Bacilli bacterium]|nr:hypothetical protein [Bacilli bacterium]